MNRGLTKLHCRSIAAVPTLHSDRPPSNERRPPVPLEIGEPAPDFTLPADGGATVSLSALRGRKVVLYF